MRAARRAARGARGRQRTSPLLPPDRELLEPRPSARTAPPPPRPRRAPLLSTWCGAALGISTALLIRATAAATVGSSPGRTAQLAFSAALCAMALGVGAPRRVTEWLAEFIRFLRPSDRAGTTDPLADEPPPRRDRALYWLVVAGIALAGGIGAAALIPWAPRVEEFHHRLLREYLWSVLTWPVLTWTMAGAKLALPMFAVGLLIRCLCRLGTVQPWTFAPMGGLLVGAAGGEYAWRLVAGHGYATAIAAATASLPFFIVAAAAAIVARPVPHGTTVAAPDAESATPVLAERWAVLVHMCIMGAALAASALTFTVVNGDRPAASIPLAWAGFGFTLPALAAGIAIGYVASTLRLATIVGFGLACTAAATSTAALVLFHGDGLELIGLGTVFLAALSCAMAWCYGCASLLVRSGQPAVVAAALLWRTCLLLSGYALLIGPLAHRWLAPLHLLTGMALVLIALGAILVMTQPVRTEQTRRARIATALAVSVVLAMTWPRVFGSPPHTAEAGQGERTADPG
ncbi:MAG: hypothetical protein C4547_01525 [Phycisphaerales bacterium]|nr:MAG: hypothetical protein C4547_01525 [Phycisphaerales bacterium]